MERYRYMQIFTTPQWTGFSGDNRLMRACTHTRTRTCKKDKYGLPTTLTPLSCKSAFLLYDNTNTSEKPPNSSLPSALQKQQQADKQNTQIISLFFFSLKEMEKPLDTKVLLPS